tara:strand:- start:1498 stop:1902 length:405 start_codon:yes stop_codon:yes gene_type:complete
MLNMLINDKTKIVEESTTNDALLIRKISLRPNLSTTTPKNGAARVPVNLKAANIPNIKGDSVCSSTNQDRIIISMNSAQFNAMSADHINRKLGTENEEKVLLATSLIKNISNQNKADYHIWKPSENGTALPKIC